MLCKILIINMLDYKFKRFIFNHLLIKKMIISFLSDNLYVYLHLVVGLLNNFCI